MGNQICNQQSNISIDKNILFEETQNNRVPSMTLSNNPLKNYLAKGSTFHVKTFEQVMMKSAKRSHKKTMINSDNEKELIHKSGTAKSIPLNKSSMTKLTDNKQSEHQKQNESQLLLSDLNKIEKEEEKHFKKQLIKMENFIKIREQPISQYYQMKQKIGEGSFGYVYRAIHKQSQEQRAIKILKGKFMKNKQKSAFLAEMHLLAKLDHPNIIKLYELYLFDGFYYVVTELCKGGSVIDLLKKSKKISEKSIANIMSQLLNSLSYMHSLNIIHRDIKLENIVFLQKNNQSDNVDEQMIPIKIIDFGTALECKNKVSQLQEFAGTLSYIAPEGFKHVVSEKLDIWSSGVLFYILLVGKSPFKGKSQSETKDFIHNKAIQFTGLQWKSVSDEAKILLLKMLDKNFHKRISATQALKMEWFNQSKKPRRSIDLSNLQNLSKYCEGNNLIASVESFLSIRRINQNERQRLGELFNEIDTDHNGTIEICELEALYKDTQGVHTHQEFTNIIHSIDKNQSGKIDFNEFLIAMTSRKKLFIQDALIEAFNYFDKDKTGFIEKNQLREIIKGCGKDEVQYFFEKMDTDHDNRISKQEFINYMIDF